MFATRTLNPVRVANMGHKAQVPLSSILILCAFIAPFLSSIESLTRQILENNIARNCQQCQHLTRHTPGVGAITWQK